MAQPIEFLSEDLASAKQDFEDSWARLQMAEDALEVAKACAKIDAQRVAVAEKRLEMEGA